MQGRERCVATARSWCRYQARVKLKVDENLPRRAAQALERAGHQVYTVLEEGLTSARDEKILRADRQWR